MITIQNTSAQEILNSISLERDLTNEELADLNLTKISKKLKGYKKGWKEYIIEG